MRQSSFVASSRMLHTLSRPICRIQYAARRHFSFSICRYSTGSTKPLRIMFCGSDDFSIASLRALHEEKLRDPEAIASIDVLTRTPKLSGRGMKVKRYVPIKNVAEDLGYTVYERDTLSSWSSPRPEEEAINLIVTVSFGLKVSRRLLREAEYGGINLHPSLLPDFRGPAPFYHTLLAGETHTGVTLQTLHPQHFDRGMILAQTARLEIPNASKCTYEELRDFVTPKAAELLIQGIRNRNFGKNLNLLPNASEEDLDPSPTDVNKPLRTAPKLTPEDRHIDWNTWTTGDLLRRDRIIGRLWSLCQPQGKPFTRMLFFGFEDVTQKSVGLPWFETLNRLAETASDPPAGNMNIETNQTDAERFFLLPMVGVNAERVFIPCVKQDESVVMRYPNGDAVLVKAITLQSSEIQGAAKALERWSRSAKFEVHTKHLMTTD